MGGRFATLGKPSFTGTTPGPSVPRQPPGSPWATDDLLGPEPPLGIDVNAMDPVGEAFEVEASKSEKASATDPAPVSVRLRRRL
jgi:hypothetical protein